jgi:hypothetical protein
VVLAYRSRRVDKEVDVVRSTTTMPHACRHDRGARMTFTFDAGLLPFACFASLSREGSNSYVGSQETASARMVAKAETTDRRSLVHAGKKPVPANFQLPRGIPSCYYAVTSSHNKERKHILLSLERCWDGGKGSCSTTRTVGNFVGFACPPFQVNGKALSKVSSLIKEDVRCTMDNSR